MRDTGIVPRKVLCVDDEPSLLEGMTAALRRDYDVRTAADAAAALAVLEAEADVAVVIADLRMPGTDGATLLAQVQQRWPDISRLLLTGHPEQEVIEAAMQRVSVLACLAKPCLPSRLAAAIAAAVREHDLRVREREVMQQTLVVTVGVLVDALALGNPAAYGRTGRIVNWAHEIAEAEGVRLPWQVEVAALLSQIGFASLPNELVERIYDGAPIQLDEQILVSGVSQVAHRIAAGIPRLEEVAEILDAVERCQVPVHATPAVVFGARLLSLVMDFDTLLARGDFPQAALETLRNSGAAYDRALLAALGRVVRQNAAPEASRELSIAEVVPGMLLVDDLWSDTGTLLAPRGFRVSDTFIGKLRNLGHPVARRVIRVRVPLAPPKPAADVA